MDLFVPNGFAKLLDERTRKLVLRSRFFDLIIDARSLTMSFNKLAPNSWEPLGELHDYAAITLLLDQASASRDLLEVSIYNGESSLFKNSVAFQEGVDPEILSFARIVENAWSVAKYLNVHDRVDVCASSLWQQKERLELFCGMIAPESCEFMIGFREKSLAKLRNKLICVPLGTEVMLGEYRCLVLVSVRGILKGSGEKHLGIAHVLRTRDRKIEETYAARTKKEHTPTLKAAVRAFADSLDDSVNCLILEQYAQ